MRKRIPKYLLYLKTLFKKDLATIFVLTTAGLIQIFGLNFNSIDIYLKLSGFSHNKSHFCEKLIIL